MMSAWWLVLIIPLSYALGALTIAALVVCGDNNQKERDFDDQLEDSYR